MKKYFNHIGIALCIIGLLSIVSCGKMDETYKPFVTPNGVDYVGKADSLMVYSGRNRIKISWLRGTDPNAVKAIIYWNNKADSVIIPITGTNPDDTINVIIDDLPENAYTFNIYTFDKYGHSSIRVDALGNSYDSLYESKLLVRPVDTVIQDGNDAVIHWFSADAASFASEIKYTDSFGVMRHVIVSTDVDTTALENYKFGTSFLFRSLYKPDSLCIDTFYTAYDSVFVKLIPKNPNLALNRNIADKSSDGSSGRATELVDGDQSTHWQPLGADRRDDSKVWVTIDLGNAQTFNELKQFWTHGHQHIDYYTIYYSDDNSTWKIAYVSGSGPDEGENKATFLPVTGQYVKLELHFADDGNVNIGEIEVYNDPAVTPPSNLALGQSIADKSSDCSCGRSTNLIDADPSTYWQPLSGDRSDKELWVIIDLGASLEFNKVDQYWKKGEGQVESYQILYSDDNTTWNTAYENNSGISSEVKAVFHTVKGRYVKLVFKLNDTSSEQVSEIEIYDQE